MIDDATVLAGRPLRARRPAWILILTVDLASALTAGLLVGSGRLGLAAMVGIEAVLLQAAGQYRSRLNLRFLDDLLTVVGRALIAFAMVAGFSYALGHRQLASLTTAAALAVFAQTLGRVASYRVIRWARAKDMFCHDAVIIGAGDVARRLADTLLADRSLGLRPVGYVSDGDYDEMPCSLERLGSAADLSSAIDASDATVVIVAFNGYVDRELVESLRMSERRGRDLFIVPRLFEFTAYGQHDTIGGIPVVRVKRPRLNRMTWLVKRTIDIVFTSVALVVLSPVMLVAALGVRLEGGPGVIFRQTRIGLDGQQFQLMKFRSLKPVDETESATRWNVSHDDRLGPFGRILRRTSIDELPQLFNILRGEMTLVGPRPERPHFVHQFSTEIPSYRHRHRVPAGLTGLAQVNGLRGDTSIADRARYDNFYIENWSLWLDVKIMAATVREVVGARGA
jgi:exopolysaccharide biosynthesis polyprenyl glycosylphosphotransferase